MLYFGVQISTRVQLTLALISVAVVLAFFIKVIVDLGSANDVAKTFNPSSSDFGWSGIFFGVLYGVLIFVGFETAANLAEEAAEPKRAIPRAVLLSVVVVSVFYLIAAYTQVAGFGFNLENIFAAAAAPLFALGAPDAYGSDFIEKAADHRCPAGHPRRRRGRRDRLDAGRVRDGARPPPAGSARACLPQVRNAVECDRADDPRDRGIHRDR